MSKIHEVIRDGKVIGWAFVCPGCQSIHMPVPFMANGTLGWQFNGNLEHPTFIPSLLATWDFGAEKGKRVCHSFVTNGRIQFLNDSTHKHAGLTMEIPEFNDFHL